MPAPRRVHAGARPRRRARRGAWVAAALLLAALSSRAPSARAGAPPAAGPASPGAAPTIAILCYHDVSDTAGSPLQTVSPAFLRAQIRACRAAGWTFVSLGELIERRDHPERLPSRTMVLTFDDGYRSFRDRALPVLREERVPATLAVISSFVDHPPADLPPLLTWEELRELAADSLVEIASHSHDLHRFVTNNPYKDTAPSAATRRYLLAEARYENREEYRSRIAADLASAQRTLRERLGREARVLVWPYGLSNEMARALADAAGFHTTLALGGREVTPDDLHSGLLPRVMVTRTMRFARGDLAWLRPPARAVRAARVDLDALYDGDPAVFGERLDRLVRRVREIGATHVFLQACSDPAGDGRIRAAWFTNHQLPVRADVWSMVASRLVQARVKVWARVPTMNLTWAWQQHPEWRLGDTAGDGHAAARGPSPAAEVSRALAAWPTRLSPDLPEARRAAIDFLTDLAVYAPIDGVLFGDDAFMAPAERLALFPGGDAGARAGAIESLLAACRSAVRAWRPECAFGRDVPAAVVEASGPHAGLSQDFGRIVRDDGLVVVRADPWASGHGTQAPRWIERLGRRAMDRWTTGQRVHGAGSRAAAAPGTAPVLLELQAYDGGADRWVSPGALTDMMAALRRAGVTHVGLSPLTATDGNVPARVFDRADTIPLATGGPAGP